MRCIQLKYWILHDRRVAARSRGFEDSQCRQNPIHKYEFKYTVWFFLHQEACASLKTLTPLFTVTYVLNNNRSLMNPYLLLEVTFAGSLHSMIFELDGHLRHLRGTGNDNTARSEVGHVRSKKYLNMNLALSWQLWSTVLKHYHMSDSMASNWAQGCLLHSRQKLVNYLKQTSESLGKGKDYRSV